MPSDVARFSAFSAMLSGQFATQAPLPFFCTNCPHGSHFAQMASHFAQNTTPNPHSFLSRHAPLSWTCKSLSTKNSPKPTHKNTPFSGLNLKVGKINYSLGKMRSLLGNMFEKWTRIF